MPKLPTWMIHLSIRDAAPAEAAALEGLQRRSSGVWKEDRAASTASPDGILIDRTALADGHLRVACTAGTNVIAGFSAVTRKARGAWELGGIFVEPSWMRSVVERFLVADLVARARAEGAQRIEVVADPRAAGSYTRLGFRAGEATMTRFGPSSRMVLAL